jgi:hypothetical protein
LVVSEKLLFKNAIKEILRGVWVDPETKYWGKRNDYLLAL